jgi:hypothetical protein
VAGSPRTYHPSPKHNAATALCNSNINGEYCILGNS